MQGLMPGPGYQKCSRCGSPGTGGHLHPEQCVKALRNDVASMGRTLVMLADKLSDGEQERIVQKNILWRMARLLGGKVTLPDDQEKALEGHGLSMDVSRTENAFVVEAGFKPMPNAPEPAIPS